MTFLLDTHTLLWFLTNDPNLSTRARDVIEDSANVAHVSAASLWEIAIKFALEKLKLPFHHRDPFDRLLLAQAKTEGMTLVTDDGQFASYRIPLLW